MDTENKDAKTLFQWYKKQYNDLSNMYCQMRENHPLGRFPKVAQAIWRAGLMADIWRRVAEKNGAKGDGK